jgi:hypothetical protein
MKNAEKNTAKFSSTADFCIKNSLLISNSSFFVNSDHHSSPAAYYSLVAVD